MVQRQPTCEICGATFDSEADLEDHHRKLHPKYGCAICGETFSSESQLEMHYRVEHPEQTATL